MVTWLRMRVISVKNYYLNIIYSFLNMRKKIVKKY